MPSSAATTSMSATAVTSSTDWSQGWSASGTGSLWRRPDRRYFQGSGSRVRIPSPAPNHRTVPLPRRFSRDETEADSPDLVHKHHADMGVMLDQGAIEEVT